MIADLVKKSRSYRGYDESYKFTKEELLGFVDSARLAPSSMNIQPLKYYIAWEHDEVEEILPLTGWAKALPDLKLPREHMHPTAFIVICVDLSINDSSATFLRDVGASAQTILLSAAEKGLGGCMIGTFAKRRLKEKLGLGEEIEPMLVVALGKPAETIILTEVQPGESVKYYRDENDVHYVPKRKLEDIVIASK